MIRALALCMIVGLVSAASADSLVAARAIVGNSIVSAADIRFARADIEGAVSDPTDVIGREAKVTIYAGRPIRAGDFRAPALIERNDIIRLQYRSGGLVIEADGRALGGHSSALRPAHDLREPLQPVAAGGRAIGRVFWTPCQRLTTATSR